MRYLNLIGPQIRRLRSQKGWTQEELAGALQRAGLDISRSGLAKIEARMVWVGDHETIFFMKVLGVSFEDLLPPMLDVKDPDLYFRWRKLMSSRF